MHADAKTEQTMDQAAKHPDLSQGIGGLYGAVSSYQ